MVRYACRSRNRSICDKAANPLVWEAVVTSSNNDDCTPSSVFDTARRLVGGREFGVFDDEDLDGGFGGAEAEAELLGEGGEDGDFVG